MMRLGPGHGAALVARNRHWAAAKRLVPQGAAPAAPTSAPL